MAEDDTIEEGVLEQLVQKLAPCIEHGDLDACVEEAAQLASEMGIDADKILILSTQMGKKGKYALAYVLALSIVEGLDDDNRGIVYSNIALIARSLGGPSMAEYFHKKAIVANENDATTHYYYANLLAELDRTYEAEEEYKKAIAIDPKFAFARHNYANLLHTLDRIDEAEEQYTETINANDYNMAVHQDYAKLLQKIGRNVDAEEQYKKAILAFPNLASVHNDYANLLQELGRYIESEWHYKKSIDADSKVAYAYNNYGFLLGKLNRKVDAEKQYQKAIDVDSDYMMARYNYAILLGRLNRNKDAEVHYLKIIDADPNNAMAHNNYANILRERGKISEAESEVRCALKIAKGNSSSQDNLPYAHATLGDILAEEGDYECAESEYKKALDKSDSMDDSSISEIYNNLGWVYTKMRKCKKAKDEFKKACNLNSMNITAKRNLRALARIRRERKPDDMSVIQIFLGGVLFFLLVVAYAMLFISMVSDFVFAMLSIAILIGILFIFNIILRAKAMFGEYGFAIEGSAGHMNMIGKTSTEDSKLEFEHSQLR